MAQITPEEKSRERKSRNPLLLKAEGSLLDWAETCLDGVGGWKAGVPIWARGKKWEEKVSLQEQMTTLCAIKKGNWRGLKKEGKHDKSKSKALSANPSTTNATNH